MTARRWIVVSAVFLLIALATAILVAACSQSASPPPTSHPPAEQADRPFIIAELTFDDALWPIARFNGKEWMNTWPEPDAASVPVPPLAEIPGAWLGQPVPREWQLWQAGTLRTVKVISARRGERNPSAGCATPAVLDLEKPPGSPSRFYGDGGFALNVHQVIDPFRGVDQKSEEWRGLGPGFVQEIDKAEQLAWSTRDHSWIDEHLLAKNRKLIDIPTELEVSQPVNAGGSHGSVYFFTRQRKVLFPDGVLGFKVYGWIRRRSAGAGWRTEGVEASSISEEGQFTLSPSVRMRHSGRDFWLMFVGGIESSGIAIYEVTDEGVVQQLAVGKAGC
jgi:hypothetical protein